MTARMLLGQSAALPMYMHQIIADVLNVVMEYIKNIKKFSKSLKTEVHIGLPSSNSHVTGHSDELNGWITDHFSYPFSSGL